MINQSGRADKDIFTVADAIDDPKWKQFIIAKVDEYIHIFTPNSSPERMQVIADNSDGFVYTVARKGVTGKDTDFSADLDNYLGHCREATDLPLALGFGVKTKADFDLKRIWR